MPQKRSVISRGFPSNCAPISTTVKSAGSRPLTRFRGSMNTIPRSASKNAASGGTHSETQPKLAFSGTTRWCGFASRTR